MPGSLFSLKSSETDVASLKSDKSDNPRGSPNVQVTVKLVESDGPCSEEEILSPAPSQSQSQPASPVPPIDCDNRSLQEPSWPVEPDSQSQSAVEGSLDLVESYRLSPIFEPDGGSVFLADRDQCATRSLNFECENSSRNGDDEPARSRAATQSRTERDNQPFRRWLGIMRKRNARIRHEPVQPMDLAEDLPVQPASGNLHLSPFVPRHRYTRSKSSTSSSMGYLAGVRSATVTVAEPSIAPRSRRTVLSSHLTSPKRTSLLSTGEVRSSIDSSVPSMRAVLDEGAWMRSLQRYNILEELLSTEESYVADMKTLSNTCSSLLSSAMLPTQKRTQSLQKTILSLLQIHRQFIEQLSSLIPRSNDSAISEHQNNPKPTGSRHHRWHSLDIVPSTPRAHHQSRTNRCSLESERHGKTTGMMSDTRTVGALAAIFIDFTKHTYLYEEYAASYSFVKQDLNFDSNSWPEWSDYERGIETLSNTLASMDIRSLKARKSLMLADLLIKPIQRICKYPLILADLCKGTPVYDDPMSHNDIQKAVIKSGEMATKVNLALDDPVTRRAVEVSQLLRDMTLPSENLPLENSYPALGNVVLCGALYVAYQTSESVNGSYMACVLYKTHVLLATMCERQPKLIPLGVIALSGCFLDEADSGWGLQCHTAPFAWKLIFQYRAKFFEVIMCACSAKERDAWTRELSNGLSTQRSPALENFRAQHSSAPTWCSLTFKPMTNATAITEQVGNRPSINRAATVGPKIAMSHVIIKNTHAVRSPREEREKTSLGPSRSQIASSKAFIPILAPRRVQRARIEACLADIWTKDVLPFPGIMPRRSDYMIKSSAASVMRKLSMVSLTSNFSRRSNSYTSISTSSAEPPLLPRLSGRSSAASLRRSTTGIGQRVKRAIDPMDLLPVDFDLSGRANGRRSISTCTEAIRLARPASVPPPTVSARENESPFARMADLPTRSQTPGPKAYTQSSDALAQPTSKKVQIAAHPKDIDAAHSFLGTPDSERHMKHGKRGALRRLRGLFLGL